ncbi:hypothetical protein BH23CHL5_BH23CHL5_12050 [soil metagenome]
MDGCTVAQIPTVTADEMRRADDVVIERFHISLIQMMGLAYNALSSPARDRSLQVDPRGKRIHVLAGKGGNGGGGLLAMFIWRMRASGWRL